MNHKTKVKVKYYQMCPWGSSRSRMSLRTSSLVIWWDLAVWDIILLMFYASVGTLMGITNGLATIPGLLSPSVVGALTDGNVRSVVYFFNDFWMRNRTGNWSHIATHLKVKCPTHPLHYMLPPRKVSTSQMTLRPTYPFSAPKCKKTRYGRHLIPCCIAKKY